MTKIRKEQLADDVVLYCGDCREVIPTLRGVDLVVSDPPYGIDGVVGDGRGAYGRTHLSSGGAGAAVITRSNDDRRIHSDKDLRVVNETFTLVRKQMSKNAWVALFYSCRITPKFFRDMSMFREDEYFGEIIWDKRTPGMGTQIRYRHENVAVWRIGSPQPMTDCMSTVEYAALRGDKRSEGSSHPHEKPHKVMLNVVAPFPGKMVLDPFCGTGSTGAAAVELKRGFIGIELSPKYFEIALRKIEKALAQPVSFWE